MSGNGVFFGPSMHARQERGLSLVELQQSLSEHHYSNVLDSPRSVGRVAASHKSGNDEVERLFTDGLADLQELRSRINQLERSSAAKERVVVHQQQHVPLIQQKPAVTAGHAAVEVLEPASPPSRTYAPAPKHVVAPTPALVSAPTTAHTEGQPTDTYASSESDDTVTTDGMPAPGKMYPVSMAYMDDSGSDEVDTALNTLVRAGSLYVGHPPIVRRMISPSPSRMSPLAVSGVAGGIDGPSSGGADGNQDGSVKLKGPIIDFGAKDFRVSRVDEAHPHHDLHNLLPAWKDAGGGVADAGGGDGAASEGSLQQAFLRHKQSFVARSKERVKAVSVARQSSSKASHSLTELGKKRAKKRSEKRAQMAAVHAEAATAAAAPPNPNVASRQDIEIADGVLALDAAPGIPPSRVVHRAGRAPKLNEKKIRKQNKRLYQRLCPEVVEARKAEATAKRLAENRENARVYGKKLRQKNKTRE